MLRGILRNVQYYLLFFSIILVLLAFQRLQWYDQGWVPHGGFDHPHGGFVGHTVSTSPDSGGVIFYGGDESKEIGLFKFKLGLFKFMLPTFSREDDWERNELSSLMTVPPPPHKKKRKGAGNKNKMHHLRLRSQVKMNRKGNDEKKNIEKQQESSKSSSVAYVVVMTHLLDTSQHHHDANTSDKRINDQNDLSFYKRAKVLSKSVEKAHAESPYGYRLYGLNMIQEKSTTANKDDRPDNLPPYKALNNLGFKIINMEDNGVQMNLDEISKDAHKQDDQLSISSIFNQHDVVVQISLNSFLLKPMDNLFDVLIQGRGIDKLKGVANPKIGHKEDDNSTSTPMGVYSFALEQSDSSTNFENELVIIKKSSDIAMKSYLETLQCMYNQLKGLDISSDQKSFVAVARKNLEVDNSKQESVTCGFGTMGTFRLDRCIYGAGNFDSTHDCSNVNMKDDLRVAQFHGGSATSSTSVGYGGQKVPQAITGAQSQRQCDQPWVLSSSNDCSRKNDDGHDEEGHCAWLCRQWFGFEGGQ